MNEVERCEPRVASLREATEQLFAESDDPESGSLKMQLQLLSERLSAVLALAATYCRTLESALKERPAKSTVVSLSEQVMFLLLF